MKINDRYEIRIVVIEDRDGVPGDCYTSLPELRKDHPNADYSFGYVIHDTQTNSLAADTADWYETPEDALRDICL